MKYKKPYAICHSKKKFKLEWDDRIFNISCGRYSAKPALGSMFSAISETMVHKKVGCHSDDFGVR